jgi:hypothetical protein
MHLINTALIIFLHASGNAQMRSIANGEENYRVPATIEDRSVLDDVKKTILEHSRDEYGGGAGSK